MNDFKRCNKVTGVQWLRKPVESMRIKVRLKPQDGIITLPKFEDYANETNSIDLQMENKTEVHSFKWQEKVFSASELHRFTDVHKCISNTELTYHNMIKNFEYEPSKVFSYIHQDYYLPLPSDNLKRTESNCVLNLNLCMERLNLNGSNKRVLGNDTSSMGHLFRSEENIVVDREQWTAMHIVFDNSNYNDEFPLKEEAVLLSIYHNVTENYLLITPDVNNLDLNPYDVETEAGVQWGYQYGVEIDFDKGESGRDLITLLKKLSHKWEKKNKQLVNFVMPQLGKKLYCVIIEILTADQFDMDNLYIEYDIKVPEEIQCSDTLHGRTHTSKLMRVDKVDTWNFGHVIELYLEVDAGTEPSVKIILEAISTDWWGRHRTEGYSYFPLTLEPGCYTKKLACTRPEELDSVEAENRRYFVGGCHLIKDLDVLIKPQMQDASFRFVTTGSIHLRWTVISQAHAPGTVKTQEYPGTSSASALLLGAEAVLKQYRKARARLAAATKDLTETNRDVQYGSGDG